MNPSARNPPSGSNRTYYPAAQFVPSQPGYSDDAVRQYGFTGSPANVSSPRLTSLSRVGALNFPGSSPMQVTNVPHTHFQRPVEGSSLRGNDAFVSYGGKRIYPEMQSNPGFVIPQTVSSDRNPGSQNPVSTLFDRMYQSSLSGSSSELSSRSDGSELNSRCSDNRTNPNATGDQFVTQLRNCSSQNDLEEFKAPTKAGMLWKASEAPPETTLSLGKPGFSRPIYAYDSFPVNSIDSGIYSNQPSLNRDNTRPVFQDASRTAASKPEKMTFLRSPLPAAPAKYAHNEHLQDSQSVKEYYSESEEPLPFNSKPRHSESKRSGNTTVDPALPDLQLTVFMRDAPPNKSFDMGESRYINKPYQRLPSDSRTGSMPYRFKKPTPLNLSNPTLESDREVVTDGGSGSPPLITPLNSGDISSSVFTPNQPRNGTTASPAMIRSGEDRNGAPVYTGPRLVPVERIQKSTGSESHSRAGSESQDSVTAERLAKRLFDLDGFRKSDVVKHMGKRTEFSQLVRESYLRNFDFSSMTLDVALRHFLSHLVLSGETQERERVLAQFSQRFNECNPHSIGSQDSVHVLVCAIMILNTDLHRENGRKRMTVHEFIENLSGQNNGGTDFPKDLLKNIYHSIKNEPIEFQTDSEEANPDSSKDEKSVQLLANPFLDIPDPSKAREFKTGYLMRKCCLESDGRRTPMGKRGWKMFRASLRELILYLHKDEHGFNCGTTFDDTSNAIRIHHSLAMDASDYGKRHDVFRLRSADWSEYLFQASDSQECQSWIDTINGVAAAFSAPPLPGAVGSQIKFQRPLMPSSSTKLSLADQLAQHEQTLAQVEKDLAEHREFVPEKGSKPRVIQDYLDKETYLEFEQRRFRMYCVAIQLMLQSNVDKTETAEGYFEKMRKSQGSGRFPKKTFTKEGPTSSMKEGPPTSPSKDSEVDNTDTGLKKSRLQQAANANLYHGLTSAKSVPVLYESRV